MTKYALLPYITEKPMTNVGLNIRKTKKLFRSITVISTGLILNIGRIA